MGIGDMLQAMQDAEDAARYRWLKKNVNASGEGFSDTAFDLVRSTPEQQWDSVIDTAIRAERTTAEAPAR